MIYVVAGVALVAAGAGVLAIHRKRERDAWARVVLRLWDDD